MTMIKPKHVFQYCLDLIPVAILAESSMQFRRHERRGQEPTYTQLLLCIIALISIMKIATYFREHYLENEICKLISEPRFYSWMESSQQRQHYTKHHITLGVISGISLVCSFLAAYMDKPFVVYSTLAVIFIAGSFIAFQDDRLLWHVTFGYRIDEDTAYDIYETVDLSRRPHLGPHKTDVLDIRYFLCDSLRRRYIIPNSRVKDLLEIFPDFMSILDRDGLTTPFELACHYSSVDIVQYMVELDEKLLESRDELGNTPLHWACQNTTSGCVDIVQYMLPNTCTFSFNQLRSYKNGD